MGSLWNSVRNGLARLNNSNPNISNLNTPIGGAFVPTIDKNAAQRVFSTESSNPNLPKPQSLFYVYFSLNKDLPSLINWKDDIVSQMAGTVLSSTLENSLDIKQQVAAATSILQSSVEETNTTNFLEGTKTASSWYGIGASSLSKVDVGMLDAILSIETTRTLAYEIGKMVKSYTMPSIKLETRRFNEYNRRRNLYTGKTEYGDLTFKFYDVKENPAQMFFLNYLKLVSNDFLMKGNSVWAERAPHNNWQLGGDKKAKSFDYNPYGLTTESNYSIIDKITICEFYLDKMMAYTFECPKLVDVNFGSASHGTMDSKEIEVTFKIEGISNDMLEIAPLQNSFTSKVRASYLRSVVNNPIKKEMAGFLNTRYLSGGKSLNGDLESIIASYINGDKKFTWKNLNAQLQDTARKYGYASAINAAEKTKIAVDNITSKKSGDRWKYLFNSSRDPTSLIGSITRR